MPEDDEQEINRKSGLAYAAAFSLFAAVIAGLGLGWLLDRWLGTRPWLLVTGLVLGAAAGFCEAHSHWFETLLKTNQEEGTGLRRSKASSKILYRPSKNLLTARLPAVLY